MSLDNSESNTQTSDIYLALCTTFENTDEQKAKDEETLIEQEQVREATRYVAKVLATQDRERKRQEGFQRSRRQQ